MDNKERTKMDTSDGVAALFYSIVVLLVLFVGDPSIREAIVFALMNK